MKKVTVPEAAAETGYNAQYIRELVAEQLIWSERVGRTILVNLDEVKKRRAAGLKGGAPKRKK